MNWLRLRHRSYCRLKRRYRESSQNCVRHIMSWCRKRWRQASRSNTSNGSWKARPNSPRSTVIVWSFWMKSSKNYGNGTKPSQTTCQRFEEIFNDIVQMRRGMNWRDRERNLSLLKLREKMPTSMKNWSKLRKSLWAQRRVCTTYH